MSCGKGHRLFGKPSGIYFFLATLTERVTGSRVCWHAQVHQTTARSADGSCDAFAWPSHSAKKATPSAATHRTTSTESPGDAYRIPHFSPARCKDARRRANGGPC